MLKRVLLFVATNVAVLLVLSIVLSLLGIGGVLDASGVDLDLGALLVFSAVIGFTGSLFSLAISKPMAKWSTGAEVITTPRTELEGWLLQTVRELSDRAGISPPEVAIYPSEDVNAFATGARRNAALVAVSAGLLRRMPRQEARAVLAHEIAHVANGDMVTLTLIQGVVNTFVIFASRVIGHVVDRQVFKTERGHGPGYFIVSLVMQLVLGFLASAIVMSFSRWREYRADRGAAELVGAPPMISALERLRSDAPAELPEAVAAFGIRGGGGIAALFSSHPPIEERIAALRGR